MVKGYNIPFTVEPSQEGTPKPLSLSADDHNIIDAELKTLLQKGVIEQSCHEAGEFNSNIFTREKNMEALGLFST